MTLPKLWTVPAEAAGEGGYGCASEGVRGCEADGVEELQQLPYMFLSIRSCASLCNAFTRTITSVFTTTSQGIIIVII